MTHFTLSQRSVGKMLAEFHVQDEAGNICGSINVPREQAAD
jgi:hypothetical protein